MRATEAKEITARAKEDGYDYIVDYYLKKVKRAAHLGESSMEDAILSWYKLEAKHINWFIDRGYEVKVDGSKILIEWKK